MSNEKSCASTSINWFPGHMAKTRRQITEDLKLIDVVVELLDARIPISSQNPEIAQITNGKKKIIVLNKCDLSDEKENQKWVNYFNKKQIPVVLVDSNTGKGIENCLKQIENIMQEDLEKHAQKGRIGRKIKVMVLGIPNVGKSSFINRIAKKTSAGVFDPSGQGLFIYIGIKYRKEQTKEIRHITFVTVLIWRILISQKLSIPT